MTVHLGHGQYQALADLYDEGSPVSLTSLDNTPGTNMIHALKVEFFANRDDVERETRYLTPEGYLVERESEARESGS